MSDRGRAEPFPTISRRHRGLRRAFRPGAEEMEPRALMAVLAPIPDIPSPAGLGFQLPLDGGSGNPQTYTVVSDNPSVAVAPAQGNFWSIGVSHASSGLNDPAFSGTLVFQLFGDLTPLTVAKIEQLINSGFYTSPTQPTDGSTPLPSKNFHRIVTNFVAQAGSLTGNGTGSVGLPGFPFPDEFNQQTVFNGLGQLAMANAGDDTNDSQFFATYSQTRNLDYNHTIFGQLVSGQETFGLMEDVAKNADGEMSTPISPVLITSSTLSPMNPDGVLHIDTTRAQIGESANVTVTATDPSDGTTATRTFQVNVTPNVDGNGVALNEPPFLDPVPDLTVATGQPAVFRVTAQNPEPDDVLTYVVNGGTGAGSSGSTFLPVQNATATVDANGIVTVTPTAGFTGTINLQVGVRDQVLRPARASALDDPANFDTQDFTLTVRDGAVVNLAPIAVPAATTVAANLPTTVQLAGLTGNPGTTQTLTYEIVGNPASGTISNFDPNAGTFTYTPNPDFTGTDSVSFQVTDVGDPTPNLTSAPATVTLTVGGIDTGAVRLLDRVLIVTPPPRSDHGTNVVGVDLVNGQLRVRVNGTFDQNQPAIIDVDRLVIYGTKASDQITVSPDITIPATLSGGLAGRNTILAGNGQSRLHGWFGQNLLTGGANDDYLAGRAGRVRFRTSQGNDIYFAGTPMPPTRRGVRVSPNLNFSARPMPPSGTFFRAVNGRLVAIPTPRSVVLRSGNPAVGQSHVPVTFPNA